MVPLPAELVDPFLALLGRIGRVRGKRKIGRTPLPCMTRGAAELFRRSKFTKDLAALQTLAKAQSVVGLVIGLIATAFDVYRLLKRIGQLK